MHFMIFTGLMCLETQVIRIASVFSKQQSVNIL